MTSTAQSAPETTHKSSAIAEHRTVLATEMPTVAGRLSATLLALHGPTSSVSNTMSELVPFPTTIGSIGDADVLDLSVEITTCPKRDGRTSALVNAQVRYATELPIDAIRDFYVGECDAASAAYDLLADPDEYRNSMLATRLDEFGGTSYVVAVEECGSYRAVKVQASYVGFDHAETFARFANWHESAAPVGDATPTGLEITTLASGRRPETVALYTTQYDWDQACADEVRPLVTQRLNDAGWTYNERHDGILFLDGPFDAETHLFSEPGQFGLDFVGEFQLRG